MNAAQLNSHLESDGVVVVATYTKATEYSRKHAGWFFENDKGDLCVKHGRSSHQLSCNGRMMVGIRTGRYVG